MARIFNIYFMHEEELRSAIVSVHSTPLLTEYVLGNVDPDLRYLLPPACTIASRSGLLFFQNSTAIHSSKLMDSIINSLRNHLRASQPSL
jgi:hypothetical protein